MRFLILIIISLALAGGVVFYFQSKGTKTVARVDDSEYVLVARVDVLPGTFIKFGEHLAWREIPDGKYEEEKEIGFVRKGVTDVSKLEGGVTRAFIQANEPVERATIVTPKERGFMSAVLFPGMRAISVGVNVISGNAGFIFPGDRVDLVLTHEVQKPDGERVNAAETFVEDVRVLAIDQQVASTERKATVAKTVTLEVTPKQAEQILVAEELGKISLILRSLGAVTFNDVEDIETKHYTRDKDVSEMIGIGQPDDGPGVSIFRGGNR